MRQSQKHADFRQDPEGNEERRWFGAQRPVSSGPRGELAGAEGAGAGVQEPGAEAGPEDEAGAGSRSRSAQPGRPGLSRTAASAAPQSPGPAGPQTGAHAGGCAQTARAPRPAPGPARRPGARPRTCAHVAPRAPHTCGPGAAHPASGRRARPGAAPRAPAPRAGEGGRARAAGARTAAREEAAAVARVGSGRPPRRSPRRVRGGAAQVSGRGGRRPRSARAPQPPPAPLSSPRGARPAHPSWGHGSPPGPQRSPWKLWGPLPTLGSPSRPLGHWGAGSGLGSSVGQWGRREGCAPFHGGRREHRLGLGEGGWGTMRIKTSFLPLGLIQPGGAEMPGRRRGPLGSAPGQAPSWGLGTAQPGGEVFGDMGLSPLHCGPVSKRHQRRDRKLLSNPSGWA